MKITQASLEEDFRRLRIKAGDLLFITGGMKSIGSKEDIDGNLYDFFIPVLLKIIGDSGTLVTYAYTKQYLLKSIKESDVFTKSTISTSGGAIANLMLAHKNVVRSSHPTSSCVAIGRLAHEILDDHTPSSTAYSVLGKLVEFDAKLIVFGCLDTNPGMPLLHYVEEYLGLFKRNTSLLSFLRLDLGVYFFDKNGEKKIFRRPVKDVGGCYYGTYRLFKEYDSRDLWIKGNLGKSIAVQVSAQDSFKLESELISKNNALITCDDPYCIRCNLLTPRKKHTVLYFFAYKIWVVLIRVLIAIIKHRSIKETLLRVKINYNISQDPIFKEVIHEIHERYS
ncbi:MAG: AAC(3) family N-acetyltransferase [Anaerovoracaceae bacterium]